MKPLTTVAASLFIDVSDFTVVVVSAASLPSAVIPASAADFGTSVTKFDGDDASCMDCNVMFGPHVTLTFVTGVPSKNLPVNEVHVQCFASKIINQLYSVLEVSGEEVAVCF